ncbi:MAG: nitrogen regulation protein NR(I), partial [Gammaproteobacteria bacterium]|nr:nitrogen regulation protein NR(I) [Gammaproteobacteria bacterium]
LAAGNTALFTHLLPEFERTLIMVALKAAEGRRQKAAELLGWGRNTLTRKIRELGLE